MSDINFDTLERAALEILTLLQSAVLKHGIGEIAFELKKSDKTIYAELNPGNLLTYLETIKRYDDTHKKPSCLPKHGVIDFMICMLKTGDLSPLIALNSFFNMVCYPVPSKQISSERAAKNLTKITQIASRECTDSFNAVIGSLAGDGRVDKKEAEKVSTETMEAINALAELKAIADMIKGQGRVS